MRSDAKRNLKKVATEVLKDPNVTIEEISKTTKLSIGNVHDKLKKVENFDRTSTIIAIEETDLQIVSLGQSKTLEWIQEITEVKREDINTITQAIDKSQKRYSMLHGDVTDDEGGDKLLETILDGIRNQSKGIDCPEIPQ